ncbi:DUF3102 domain-containing protein [Variovorax sp. J22R115]|uniref:DUF3102 domain-containing protein n=1 Tax=Variovorax sp. J22R115 TaxID=3053509 RepID=UPI002574A93B|nr:DUF3102 domain-containing protein [Variovorax sp. J22R115]MDM0053665.1 DUF3102 domain-containing protein [Variovorax sp. J22R115]
MKTIHMKLAAAINRQHDLACTKANDSINHALEAGQLLHEVKAALPRAEWLAWLESNIHAPADSVRRYMRLAQGKSLPKRAPKSSEVMAGDHGTNSTQMSLLLDLAPAGSELCPGKVA